MKQIKVKHSLPVMMIPILWVATILRIFRLDGQSMWFDEAARVLMAWGSLGEVLTNAGRDTLPPFYHLWLHIWSSPGDSDFWLRLPSALAGVLTVAVMYQLGCSLFNYRVGLLSAIIAAGLPFLVYHAQQATMYSLHLLLSALIIWFFWLAWTRNRPVYWVGYGILTILGLYTHYFAGVLIAILHLFALVTWRSGKEKWPALLVADVGIMLLFIPQLVVLGREFGVVSSSFWLSPPTLVQPIETLLLFLLSYSLPGSWMAAGMFVVLVGLALGLYEGFNLVRRNPANRRPFGYVMLVAFVPIILVWIVSQRVPVYLSRALLISLPGIVLMLALPLQRLNRRSPYPYLLGAMGIFICLSLGHYFFNPQFYKPDFRAAAAFVGEHGRPGDVILHTGNGAYIPFLMYLDHNHHVILAGDPAPFHPPRLFDYAGGAEVELNNLPPFVTLWLITARDHSIEWQEAQLNALLQQFKLAFQENIGGIDIYQLDGH